MPASTRPSIAHARRVRALLAATAGLGALLVLVFALTGGWSLLATPQSPAYTGPTPWDFTVATWDALGGDSELTADTYSSLDQWQDPDLGEQVAATRALAKQVALADLTGVGRDEFDDMQVIGQAPYWPATSSTGTAATARCSEVQVHAVSPAALPTVQYENADVVGYAKVLVAYTGTCAEVTYTLTDPGVAYVYLAHTTQDGWVPVRSWQVPARTAAAAAATEPYDWELDQLTSCTNDTVIRNRIAVVDAFEQMCAAAAADGVAVTAVTGYRTRAEQASAFQDAIQVYGSEVAARQRVAYADADVCTSKHCSGLAFNVDPTDEALTWLSATVGCVDVDGTVTAATSCTQDQTPVANAARWGFSAPLAISPGYLEFTLALPSDADSSLRAPNCAATGVPVANQVAAIFRCRLAREGIVGTAQDTVVAQALVVSRCESGWSPSAAAFGGRYATQVNPTDGLLYTQRGLFMLSKDIADAGWVDGGQEGRDDAVANINAAASLWLSTGGWEQFGCATGTTGGFESGPVLPQYGGPELPAWAFTF